MWMVLGTTTSCMQMYTPYPGQLVANEKDYDIALA